MVTKFNNIDFVQVIDFPAWSRTITIKDLWKINPVDNISNSRTKQSRPNKIGWKQIEKKLEHLYAIKGYFQRFQDHWTMTNSC
jgi:hypothetical protein